MFPVTGGAGFLNRQTADLIHCKNYAFIPVPKKKVALPKKQQLLTRLRQFTVEHPVIPEAAPFPIDIVFTCLDAKGVLRLRYAVRSVYAYASWARCIYLVVPDTLPIAWLRDESAQASIPAFVVPLSLLYGTEYLDHTPTQNRLSVECHLHKIPQLSDNFLYLTENMLLGKPTQWSHFFTKDAYPKYTMTEIRIGPAELKIAALNSSKVMDSLLDPIPRRFAAHQAIALCTKWFTEAWANPDIRGYLSETSSCTQLQDTNVSLLMLLVHWSKHSDYTGNTSTHSYVQLSDGTNVENELVSLLRMSPSLFCINVGKITQSQQIALDTFLQFYFSRGTPVERS